MKIIIQSIILLLLIPCTGKEAEKKEYNTGDTNLSAVMDRCKIEKHLSRSDLDTTNNSILLPISDSDLLEAYIGRWLMLEGIADNGRLDRSNSYIYIFVEGDEYKFIFNYFAEIRSGSLGVKGGRVYMNCDNWYSYTLDFIGGVGFLDHAIMVSLFDIEMGVFQEERILGFGKK